MEDEKKETVAPETWPTIPRWMVNPLVFRDANLGIVLVAGNDGEQMIHQIFGKHPPAWITVRKVDERDGFRMVDALNLPRPVSLPPIELQPLPSAEDLDAVAAEQQAKRPYSAPVLTPMTVFTNLSGLGLACSACRGEFEYLDLPALNIFPKFCPKCGRQRVPDQADVH